MNKLKSKFCLTKSVIYNKKHYNTLDTFFKEIISTKLMLNTWPGCKRKYLFCAKQQVKTHFRFEKQKNKKKNLYQNLLPKSLKIKL